MLGSLARRERRPLWGVLALLLAAAVGLSLWASFGARADAQRAASLDAGLVAQTELAPLLLTRDLTSPVTGARAENLTAGIRDAITSVGPIEQVRIFSSTGRILYASDPAIVGTRPSFLRDLVFEVASADARGLIRGDQLQTYVPVWLTPGGTVAVAELSQPFGPIAAEATGSWNRLAMIAGGLLLGCLAMVVVTTKRVTRTSPTPVQLYAPAVPRRASFEAPVVDTSGAYRPASVRALEEQRVEAERRAQVVEENFVAVQKRLKDALAQVKELEGRLAANESQSSTNDGELAALREQLRETSERLHRSELDNNALRERMALRQQELDESRRLLVEARTTVDGVELRTRIDAADARAGQMLGSLEELDEELQASSAKLRLRRLSEALSELDGDVEIEHPDALSEEAMVIRNGHAAPQAVR
jgi:hypothetical protein